MKISKVRSLDNLIRIYYGSDDTYEGDISKYVTDHDIEYAIRSVHTLEKNYFNELLKQKIGEIEGISIFLVDGDVVEKKVDMDYVEGGHDLVYDWIPEKEIWIDSNLDSDTFKYIILHEFIERSIMEKFNLDYETAHKIANTCEKKFRTMSEEA
jgi:hypothetical protein